MQRLTGGGACCWLVCLAVLTGAVSVSAPAAYAANTEENPVAASSGLPDGRVYELVSPPEKSGNEAGLLTGREGAYGVGAPDGERLLYASSGAIGNASSGVDNFSVAERASSGWSTRSALPAPVGPIEPRDLVSLSDPTSLLASSDLSKMAFTARNPFAPSNLDFENPEFAFSSTFLAPVGGLATWIGAPTVEHPDPAMEEVADPSNLALVGASSDLSVVYFEYYGTLVSEDEPRLPALAAKEVRAWGLYEWRNGRLKAAGLLPNGNEDPDGAMAAGIGERVSKATPPDYDNEVSQSGNTALFVSPAPEVEGAQPPQLYARIDGTKTVLVSESRLTGEPPDKGVDATTALSTSRLLSYAYGSPDGSKVFFNSENQLTSEAPAQLEPKEYQFDTADSTLTYLPGVTQPVISSSQDGNALAFYDTTGKKSALAIWEGGRIQEVTPLPIPKDGSNLYVDPVRFAAGTSTLVFQTNASIPGFNNGEGDGEIYRYDRDAEKLTCVSCPPTGQIPVGTAELSNDGLFHLARLLNDSRGVTEDGSEIFFDTPDKLVSQDENEERDVYEWDDGRLSLISSGAPDTESLFLDNSASGRDVFFTTNAGLSSADTDGTFDVYDARVGGGFPTTTPSRGCAGSCPAPEAPLAALPSLSTTALLGPGDQVGPPPPSGVRIVVQSRARLLAKSLAACRKHPRLRRKCEAKARKRYGKRPAKRRR